MIFSQILDYRVSARGRAFPSLSRRRASGRDAAPDDAARHARGQQACERYREDGACELTLHGLMIRQAVLVHLFQVQIDAALRMQGS